MKFDLSQYALVEERLAKFWSDHPNGAVITEIAHREADVVIFKAYIYFERGAELVATGYAEEIRDSSPVNRTSFVENAETSSIGRALANCGYQMKKRASREEMQKVERRTAATSSPTIVNNVHDNAETGELIDAAQRKTLAKLVTDLGLNKQFRPFASKFLDRDITDVGQVTKKEATRLIAEMIRMKNAQGEAK